MSRHRLLVPALLAAVSISVSACATTPAAGPATPFGVPFLGDVEPAPPRDEVMAQGTVMDVGGEVELCLGAVLDSYPPQCSGIPLELWSWDNLQGAESSGDTTWGSYAVQGTYDGETFTMTQPPVMLALYDPMPFADPTGGKSGTTEETTLLEIQQELHDRIAADILVSGPRDGYLWLDVVWDDGTLQQAADDEFGEHVVIVSSALRELGH